ELGSGRQPNILAADADVQVVALSRDTRPKLGARDVGNTNTPNFQRPRYSLFFIEIADRNIAKNSTLLLGEGDTNPLLETCRTVALQIDLNIELIDGKTLRNGESARQAKDKNKQQSFH